jgi:cytochrome c oxidase assembly protein subunit 15
MEFTESIHVEPSTSSRNSYPKAVQWWLLIGVVMVFVQVVVGGITRLTGSGLSITKWEIITGTLPPLNAAQWEEAFDLYRATPQYQKINEGMSMGQFKFIYFWEYIHRLWGRLMGFVFIIPFFIFWRRGWIDRPLMRRLAWVIPLAALVASFGWIMVASGLTNRPWVNAYKLTMHLSLALILFGYLVWIYFGTSLKNKQVFHNALLKKWTVAILVLLALQIMLGGVMSGMKAALFYPTWPDMNGAAIPNVLLEAGAWNAGNFVHYDSHPFMSALIQLLHRSVAYILIIIVLWFAYRGLKAHPPLLFRLGLFALTGTVLLQALLGILTVINSVGAIPVALGVLHQGVALILLSCVLFLLYQQRRAVN